MKAVYFWTYLFSDIVSLIYSFLVIYFLLTDRVLRRALNNHINIVLLIIGISCELTEIPWTLYSDYNHRPLIQSHLFYSFWTLAASPLYALHVELFAWATMERHILIFHHSWVSTRKKRFLVHYLPMSAIIIYYLIYYGLIFFDAFCVDSFEAFLATGFHIPCAFDRTVSGVWDLMFHQVVPILIIIVFSIALIVRVVLQKNRLRRGANWRKNRKMTVQLLSIATTYIIFNSPWVMTALAFQNGLSTNVALVVWSYTSFLSSFLIFLFPFVCCLSLSELRNKFKTNLLRGRQPPRRIFQATYPVASIRAAETNM